MNLNAIPNLYLMIIGNFIYIKKSDNMAFENFDEWKEEKSRDIENFDDLEESLKKQIYELEKSTEDTYDEVELEEVKENELHFIWCGSLEDIEDEEQREIAENLEIHGHHWTGIIDFLNAELDTDYDIFVG